MFPYQTFATFPNLFPPEEDNHKIGTVVVFRALPFSSNFLQFVKSGNFSSYKSDFIWKVLLSLDIKKRCSILFGLHKT